MSAQSGRSRRLQAIALLGGGVAAGVIGAATIGANAQSSTTATPTPSSLPGAPGIAPDGSHWHGNGETPVTGTKAATLKAAAAKQVPGGTVEDVTTETDRPGATYEVHVTKADGTRVSVLYDANLRYVATESHAGHGGPPNGGPKGGPGGGLGEIPVTGAKAATLRTEALKQVPGATVERVSTDSGDAAYEVHLRKADGTEVTAKFDKNLKFVAVEPGRGR